ncbi:MAG: DUF5060 domain-containing protein [Verrucomicrobia bacterium]|nr:DUF5060 domain-containing protein [Verrucomicrobiota bacterium]
MNPRFLAFIFAACSCVAADIQPELPPLKSSGKLAIESVQPSATRVGRYEKLELALRLSATFENPFDPEQIEVTATFTTPGGAHVKVPGFFYQPYRVLGEEKETAAPLLESDGPPLWKVRFTPIETGPYRCRVAARDRSGRVESAPMEFESVPTERHGFVRVNPRSPRYFEFDDGAPFIPVGQNLQNDWHTWRHSRLLAEAGCNAARAWTFCHWTWLEWTHNPKLKWPRPGHYMRSYGGAGVYNQRIAWIADHCLDGWERDGLRVMLCLGNSGELSKPDSYGDWGGHPCNAANGGPCAKATDFWTDPRARQLYRQRLRYIVARYGYSTAVWAWELWNELGAETDAQVAWQTEMAALLRSLDPNRHLITTSHWGANSESNARTWSIQEMDFTQSHIYHGAETARARIGRMRALSPKPHIVGEGGGPESANADPDGIEIHNALWASVMSGAAGPTLPWWWRERIEPRNLFYHYTAVAKFLGALPWREETFVPLAADAVKLSAPAAKARYSPVVVVPLGQTGRKAPRNRFIVLPDGTLEHAQDFSCALYGKGRASWANPPTFEVNYPVDGEFTVQVNEASHAIVEVVLDRQPALRDADFNVSRKYFRKDLTIAVPAGRHEITLHNRGSDWAHLTHLLLSNYRDTVRHPDMNVYGLRSGRTVALWFHHRLNAWNYATTGFKPALIAGAKACLPNMRAGLHRIEWWDTRRGVVTKTEQQAASHGELELTLPALHDDVACIVCSVQEQPILPKP